MGRPNITPPEVCNGGRDSALSDGHKLSEDDESRIAEDVDSDSGTGRSLLGPPGTSEVVSQHQRNPTPFAPLIPVPPPPPPLPPSQQQSSSGSVIRWEKFLPFRSLKVLLVENDDSTRHVLSALLRNCSYEVTAVTNGLQALKILEDLSNHVDIVLTEVVMPGLSGIGLLCKIVNHTTCQNIPVIMMSSHDSMGLVFKCLSKGAVDFLIKPIRKNELKNLWQHVWRRCHSSSGSGSESGIHTQKSVKRRKATESGNDSDSYHEYEDTSIDLNSQDGSDNGSGTQSSWKLHAVDLESPRSVSPCNQLPEPYNSTCAQVIHPKTETLCNEWITMTRSKDHQEKEVLDQEFLQKASDYWMVTGEPDNKPKAIPSEKVPRGSLGSQTDVHPNNYLLRNNHDQTTAGVEAIGSCPQAADLIRTITGPNNSLTTKVKVLDHTNLTKNKDKTISNMKVSPLRQLNQKNTTCLGESGTITSDNQNLLRHSDLSAFTRYNTSAASNQIPAGYSRKCSLTDDTNSEVLKHHVLSKDAPLNQGSSSNYNDMGSSTQNICIGVSGTEKPATQTTVKGSRTSAFHPVQKRNPTTQEALTQKIDHFETGTSAVHAHPKVFHHLGPDHHNNYGHYLDECALKNIESDELQCGSSNVLAGGMEFKTNYYSINGSVSGSNQGSNALNCSNAVVNLGRMNIDDDSRLAGSCAAISGNEDHSRSASGADQNLSRQSDALVNKFRQKRKERCFEKKVRYQSRKKLEQCLSVRGQSARQPTCDQDNSDS